MRNAFKYLSQYSTTPKDVDRLIISAFLEIGYSGDSDPPIRSY